MLAIAVIRMQSGGWQMTGGGVPLRAGVRRDAMPLGILFDVRGLR